VKLPREVRDPYQVFLNGVPQRLGVDFEVREGALVFEGALRKDKDQWLALAARRLGRGHVPPERLDRRALRSRRRFAAVAEGLEIEVVETCGKPPSPWLRELQRGHDRARSRASG